MVGPDNKLMVEWKRAKALGDGVFMTLDGAQTFFKVRDGYTVEVRDLVPAAGSKHSAAEYKNHGYVALFTRAGETPEMEEVQFDAVIPRDELNLDC